MMRTLFDIAPIFVLPMLLITFWAAPVLCAQEGLLDDMVFSGRSQENHISTVREEKLTFMDGELHSMAYARKGFTKGGYTAVVKQDGIHFEAVSVSPEQGTIDWRGIVSGDSIVVKYQWRKRGWLSDTVRDYYFIGAIVQ